MKEQFTPGPWKVRKMEVNYRQHYYALEASLIPIVMSHDPTTRIGAIDMVGSYSHKMIFPNLESSDGADSSGAYNLSEIDAEANAHLIAAAPDMYEALKLAKKIITETDWDVCGYSDVDIEKINAALAKAVPQN